MPGNRLGTEDTHPGPEQQFVRPATSSPIVASSAAGIAVPCACMSASDLPDLRRAHEGATLLLTLDRPDARNAYSEAMVDSLVRALDEADRDDAVRCIILTGAGAAFSADGDLKRRLDHEGMFAGGPMELRRRYIDGIQRIPRRFALAEKPVIAAINGPAIGAGLDLACMCDLRIAAPCSGPPSSRSASCPATVGPTS